MREGDMETGSGESRDVPLPLWERLVGEIPVTFLSPVGKVSGESRDVPLSGLPRVEKQLRRGSGRG